MEGGELRQRVDGGGGAGVGEAEAAELCSYRGSAKHLN